MTREEAKELLPIIQAFIEGKEIEILDDVRGWVKTENLIFNLSPNFYRIKPEPKYRPFKTKEECWNEMLKHQPFGWVIDKFHDFCHIDFVYSGKKDIYGVRFSKYDGNYNYEYILKEYQFADGTPLGIKEE